VKNPKYKNTYIQFQTSSFSIGAGPITLWAIGEFKYFEIRPSRRYKDMYRHMTEAIGIYFDLTDVYEGLKTKKKRLPLELILFEVEFAVPCVEKQLTPLVRIS